MDNCFDSATAWAADKVLSNGTDYFCVDSTGSVSTGTELAANAVAC